MPPFPPPMVSCSGRKLLAPASAVVRFRRCGRRSRGVEGLGGKRGDEGERGDITPARVRTRGPSPPHPWPVKIPPNSGRIILHLITTIRQSPEGPTHMPPGRGAWEESVHILYMGKLPGFFVPHPGPLARGLGFSSFTRAPWPGGLGRECAYPIYVGKLEHTYMPASPPRGGGAFGWILGGRPVGGSWGAFGWILGGL